MKYLSWSRYNMYHNSKSQFVAKYILGQGSTFTTKETEFGKTVHEQIENGELDAPKLDIAEYEINTTINAVPVLGYIDSVSEDYTEILEYKTGKDTWDQERVDNHGQLLMYATAIYNMHGVIPQARLVWLETSDDYGDLELTGIQKEFNRTFTEQEILEFIDDITDTWLSILNLEKEYEDVQIDPKMLEYAELKEKEKEIKEKMYAIQKEMDVPSAGIKIPEVGSFYWIERKTYQYSDEYKKKEAELKALKKEEEKTAPYTTTTSLSFR